MNAPFKLHQPVSLVSTPQPFGQQRYYAAPEGLTFAEMAARVGELPPFFWQGCGLVVVTVTNAAGLVVKEFALPQWSDDGVNLWARGKPKCPAGHQLTVAFGVNLQGGGGGGKKNTLSIVALVAVLAIGMAVSAGAFGALGSVTLGSATISGAKIVGGLISIGGAMAISALTKPPQAPSLNQRNDKPGNTAAAQVNVMAPGAPFSRVIGTKRVFPAALMQPLVEYVDDDAILECVFGLAGDHSLSAKSIRLGETTPGEGVTVDVRALTTQPLQQLVRRYGHTDSTGIQLSTFKSLDIYAVNDNRPSTLRLGHNTEVDEKLIVPQWHSIALRSASDVAGGPVDEHWINFQFAGLFFSNDPNYWVTVPFRARIRKINANGTLGDWVNLPEFHFVRNKTAQFTMSMRIIWQRKAGRPAAPPPVESSVSGQGGRGGMWAYTSVKGQSATPRTAGWNAHPYFIDRARRKANHEVYSYQTRTVTDLLNMVGKKDRWEVYLDPAVFTPGRYEMQIKRGAAVLQTYWSVTKRYDDPSGRVIDSQATPGSSQIKTTSIAGELDLFHYLLWPLTNNLHRKNDLVRFDVAGLVSECFISSVSAVINKQPSPSRDIATVAIRAVNTGNTGAMSVIASGLVPDWNGNAFVGLVETSNPAPHARYALAGALNANKVPDSLIDDTAFAQFRAHCNAKGYQCNAEIVGKTVPEAQALILGCGYAGAANGEKFSVVWERDRSAQGPTQIFTPRNMNNFRVTKPFARFSDGQLVIYPNKNDEYQDATILVWHGAARDTVEEVRFDGLVTQGEAVRRSKFDQAHVRARAATYSWLASVESIRCKKGDLVGIQSPILTSQSGWARIASVTLNGGGTHITGLVLDQAVTAFQSVTSQVPLPQRQFGIEIQHADGATTTHKATRAGDGITITFATAYAVDADIKQGCIVAIGTLGQEVRRLIIDEIRPKDTTSAEIIAFDEAPDLIASTLDAQTAQIADPENGAPIPHMLDFRYSQNIGLAAAA